MAWEDDNDVASWQQSGVTTPRLPTHPPTVPPPPPTHTPTLERPARLGTDLGTPKGIYFPYDSRRAFPQGPVALNLEAHRLDGQVQMQPLNVLVQGRVDVR
jgi:hypothetical protein